MSKARNVEILAYKIAKSDEKIANMRKYGIDEKKINALEIKKLKYSSDYDKENHKEDK